MLLTFPSAGLRMVCCWLFLLVCLRGQVSKLQRVSTPHLHFHGLHDDEGLTLLHLLARLDEQLDDLSRHRRGEPTLAAGRSGRDEVGHRQIELVVGSIKEDIESVLVPHHTSALGDRAHTINKPPSVHYFCCVFSSLWRLFLSLFPLLCSAPSPLSWLKRKDTIDGLVPNAGPHFAIRSHRAFHH